VAQAAEILGITVEAVRGRIKRRTLDHERHSGTVYVLLHADQMPTGRQPGDDQARPAALADELRDRIHYLERQVEEEREARRRADTILAQLSAANAEQARTIRAIEAPQESPEDAETVEEAPERAEPHSAAEEARDELDTERARREMAETTLREGMAEERRRREEAERERDELRREMFARREARESPETAEEQQGRGDEHHSATGEAQESSGALGGRGSGTTRGSLWRRIFGR
jgi:hypothetical protein